MREILLIRIEDQQYGVWKDEVESIANIPTLHRLPLSPACIAGMSIIDGRTITLADLPVCIGRAPASANGNARVLLLSGTGKISGFLVQGEIDFLALQPDSLVPMPGYLTTGVIDSCAILASVPVPVVNLHQLVQHLLKDGHEQAQPALTIPVENKSRGDAAEFRLFTLGGELFAADAEDIEDAGAKTGRAAALSAVPRYVKGVVLHERTVLPLVDLAQRISLQPAVNTAQMLVARFGNEKFGLLIDQDHGVRSSSELSVRELPPLARSYWLSTALSPSGGIVPVIDIAALLSSDAVTEETPLHQRYHPDSAFLSLFGTADADIVEFSLLGAKHALPKAEVADILPLKPWRVLPGNAPEIMIGVAEHEGEILPVLDLAMVFGRRSLTTPDWRMMVVKNGDFRALVITETVFGERRLPLAIQRAVPILLPHRVVYGCYPDAEAVRLILNVEAMAVHFEKSLVQELLPALSVEMKQAPAQIVPALLPQKGESGYEPQAQQQTELQPEPIAAAASVTVSEPADSVVQEETGGVTEEISAAAETESSGQEETVAHAGEEVTVQAVSEPAAMQEPKTEERDTLLTQTFEEPAGTEERAEEQAVVEETPGEEIVTFTPAVETMAEERPEAVIGTGLVQEGSVIEQEKQQNLPVSEEPELISEAAVQEYVSTEEKVSEQEAPAAAEPVQEISVIHAAAEEGTTISETASEEAQELKESVSEQETPIIEEPVSEMPAADAAQETVYADTVAQDSSPVIANEEQLQPEPEIQEPEPEVAPVGMVGATSSIAGTTAGREEAPAPVQQEPVRVCHDEFQPAAVRPSPSRPAYQETSEPSSKKWIPYAAAAVVLMGLLYFVTSNKPSVQKNSPVAELTASKPSETKAESMPALQKQQPALTDQKIGQATQRETAKPVPPKAEPVPVVQKQEPSPEPKPKPRPSLELDIPKAMPTSIEVYIVVKDDTLWSISERFTGNPFNYPRIAGENRIADPDLIFPGQKIRLLKKQ